MVDLGTHRLWYKCREYKCFAFDGDLLVIMVYLVFLKFLVCFGLISPDSDYVVPVHSTFL